MIWKYLKQLHVILKARIVRAFRTSEVIHALSARHALELADTPGEFWALAKQKQAQEIQAVRDGKFDIVDRRSWAYPYLPEALHRLNQPILKNTPYNLRRFSETPIPRRAINLIKNAVLSLRWEVKTIPEVENDSDREKRIRIASHCLRHPNNTDSYRTFMEAVIEDLIIGGYGCIEPRLTPFYKRPIKLWAVDGSTIRIFADWTEGTPDKPRYAQMTGLKGERGIVTFLSSELIYMRANVRSSTPFGLGMLEVAFNTVNAFLGAQDMAAKAGSDQVHKTWLWWETAVSPGHIQTVRRHIQNELEGQQKISLMGGLKKPEVIEVQAVNPEDLLLDWQEFLIRIIGNAFDISPMSLGLERDINRNTGQVMADSDFRAAVVPTARRVEESLTRDVIQGQLGWRDLEFVYIGLDDPDAMTQTTIQRQKYAMNALTPDEIRKSDGRAPLPGGWGRLTMGQMQILLTEASAKLGGGRSAGSGASAMGGGGFGGGAPRMGNGSMSAPMMGSAFSADEVSQMSPEEISQYQMLGLLPPTMSGLANAMEDQQPGILETLTEELQEFFDSQKQEEKKAQIKPDEISNKDERTQIVKYNQAQRSPTEVEQMYQDRGLARVQRRGAPTNLARPGAVNPNQVQPRVRGKYPRSGGNRSNYK